MTQAIDPVKLKAAAEHLEWVLTQYPGVADVQNLYAALAPLIEDAKGGRIWAPVEKIPCDHLFSDGAWHSYAKPSVDTAYSNFTIEMEGGLSDAAKRIIAKFASLEAGIFMIARDATGKK